MNKSVIQDEGTIRKDGLTALSKALGNAGALRFMTLVRRDPTDYVAISRQLYASESVDSIFRRARKNWKPRARHDLKHAV